MTMDYDKYKKNGDFCIFQKSIPQLMELYEDVKFLFPYDTPNTFHAELAIHGCNNKIIQQSNSYIEDTYALNSQSYENTHKIYTRINHTYDVLCNSEIDEVINERVCSFMSPFDSVNFGHNLSIVFDFIHRYKSLGLTCPIVLSNVSKRFPNILRILELFFDDIRFIDNNKIYWFKEAYFFTPVILDICRHQDVINETIELSLSRVTIDDSYKNKKIFMVKLANCQNNIVELNTAFYADSLLDKLEKDPDWKVIQPETMSIYEIIAYLRYATIIVTSEGAISYGHVIFCDKKTPLYFLIQNNRVTSYLYIDWMTHIRVDRNLDNNIETIYNLTNSVYVRPDYTKKQRLLKWLRTP